MLLIVASQAYLATSITTGHAEEGWIVAMRVVASRTFDIWPVQHGFTGHGVVDCVCASEKI